MRYPLSIRSAFAMALVAVPFVGAHPQSAPAAARPAATPAAAAPAAKMLELEDYARFNRITAPALSPDGKWMTFTYTPNEGGQLMLHV
ncbi:MAG TPA: hypothetical protein VGI83_02135, partial [Gemmatimonadales bacterium]